MAKPRVFQRMNFVLKQAGLVTFLVIVPGGMVMWGIREVIRWKQRRLETTKFKLPVMKSLKEFSPMTSFESHSETSGQVEPPKAVGF